MKHVIKMWIALKKYQKKVKSIFISNLFYHFMLQWLLDLINHSNIFSPFEQPKTFFRLIKPAVHIFPQQWTFCNCLDVLIVVLRFSSEFILGMFHKKLYHIRFHNGVYLSVSDLDVQKVRSVPAPCPSLLYIRFSDSAGLILQLQITIARWGSLKI